MGEIPDNGNRGIKPASRHEGKDCQQGAWPGESRPRAARAPDVPLATSSSLAALTTPYPKE